MTYDEMAANILNSNRKRVVDEIRKMAPLDAFLTATALQGRLEASVFQGFWELVRLSI